MPKAGMLVQMDSSLHRWKVQFEEIVDERRGLGGNNTMTFQIRNKR